MKFIRIGIAASLVAVSGAWAQSEKANEASAKAQLPEVLEEAAAKQAVTPPTLPDQAAERARQAHAETAFGKKAEAARAEAASRAASAAANRPSLPTQAQDGRSAGEARAAAGQARAANAASNAPIPTDIPAPPVQPAPRR
jgi:hypothetical protein